MTSWHRARDNGAMPIYEFTSQLATLEPPPPEMQQLLGSVHGNQEAMDGFVSVVAGTVSPVDIDAWLNGGSTYEAAMTSWHRARDNGAMPSYEFTSQLATLEPPPPAMYSSGIGGRQPRGDGWVRQRRGGNRVPGGVLRPTTFAASRRRLRSRPSWVSSPRHATQSAVTPFHMSSLPQLRGASTGV